MGQMKVVKEFKYKWVSTIYDTNLSLDLDNFHTNIDRRVNSWIYAEARDIRSKVRDFFKEYCKIN